MGGKQTRKEEALAYVRATMNDPDLVKAALARTTNNERLLLQLFKYFDGIVTGLGLTTAVCALIESTAKIPVYSKHDLTYLFEYLNSHHLLLWNRNGTSYRSSEQGDGGPYRGHQTVFLDHRLLAQVGVPEIKPHHIAPLETPPTSTQMRRPQNITLLTLEMLGAIQRMGGLRVNKTQGHEIRDSDFAKLTAMMKWNEVNEIDGLRFPSPAKAFTGALTHAGLLTYQNDAMIPSAYLDQYTALPFAE